MAQCGQGEGGRFYCILQTSIVDDHQDVQLFLVLAGSDRPREKGHEIVVVVDAVVRAHVRFSFRCYV